MQERYVPDFLVKIEGLTLEADVSHAVIDLTYDNDLDAADMFTLQLNNADLQFTDSALFNVGKNVEIYMGYVGQLKPMMLGEITAVRPSFPQSGAPTLTVTGYDKSHRMRHNQPDRFEFKNMNDSVIAARIAAENLLIPVVDPAPTSPRESVAQTGSDWALLKELAERNFFQVYVHWDKLYFRFPRPQTEMVVLEWRKNLSSFSPRLSTSGQHGIQVIRSYDHKLAQTIVATLPVIALQTDIDNMIERLGSDAINLLASLGRSVVRDAQIKNHFDAAVVAKSVLMELLQGLYEGSGRCIGIPTLRAGDMIEIRGIGKRFSGNYTLSKVTHTINESGYQTQFEVSQKYNTNLLQSVRKKAVESPSPNGQEKRYGIMVGKVENNIDPDNLGRVQLSFPMLSDINLSNWAHITTPMAGQNAGMYFLPDRGDTVLVEFVDGDINQPVVLEVFGMTKAKPPEKNTGRNERKVIKTKSGMQIIFDETEGNGKLVLQDKAGSTITMDSKTGDIVIAAKGNIELKSGNNKNIKLGASNDVDIDAKNVNVQVTGAMDVS